MHRSPPNRRTTSLAVFALAILPATVAAQDRDDDRDVIELRNGRELRGRVLARFEPDEVTLREGGSRTRVPRRSISSIHTVNDLMREWLSTRTTGLTVAREWELVGSAQAARLDAFARLQAYHVVEREPDHTLAHEFLGHHKRRDGVWMWRIDEKRYVTREEFDEWNSAPGHPLTLSTEHYDVRSTGGLRRTIDLAFDLERLYLFWMDSFGERIRAQEVFERMDVQVLVGSKNFPKLSTDPRPYYLPERYLSDGIGGVNTVYTWFDDEPDAATQKLAGHPVEVFEVATQQLVYSTLNTPKGAAGDEPVRRQGIWAEVGLAYWFGGRITGRPGYVELGDYELPREVAEIASGAAVDGSLRLAKSELTNLIGLRYGQLFEVRDEVPQLWAKTRAFAAFLMDEGTVVRDARGRVRGSGQDAMMRYLFEAWHEGKGHSSSRVDSAFFDVRIERLDEPWRQWLSAKLQ